MAERLPRRCACAPAACSSALDDRRRDRCSCALFAPLLAPHDPDEQDLLATLLPPAWAHGGDAAYPLGTD